ncbi:MAG: arylesterase [Casimicrobiaceae bacterium]
MHSPARSAFLRTLAAAACGWLLATAPLASAQAAAPVILIVGDSISAGYGLPANAGWASLLQQRLEARHFSYRVVNASISGDTTAGGRARLGALLTQYRPAITILELGGNDGLRGGSLEAMRANLDAMTAAAQRAASRVLLIGIRVPPNYGAAYGERFAATFADVARARRAALVPFLFAGFAEDDAMFQADRIHPVAAAQSKLLDNVWPALSPLLAAAGSKPSRRGAAPADARGKEAA